MPVMPDVTITMPVMPVYIYIFVLTHDEAPETMVYYNLRAFVHNYLSASRTKQYIWLSRERLVAPRSDSWLS